MSNHIRPSLRLSRPRNGVNGDAILSQRGSEAPYD